MKKLRIKSIAAPVAITLQQVSQLLEENAPAYDINTLNWPEAFPYLPQLQFRMAHTGSEIWLKYYVREKNILAKETRTHGDVYKDSTVEFFISLDGKQYYNFEFNCIGTIHIGYGPGRGNRRKITPGIAESIEIESSLGKQPFDEKQGDFSWEMVMRIPIACFEFDAPEALSGVQATGNFMKCGDETSDPHFVSWNPIKTENPDYHRPEFFGELLFE